MNGFSLIFDSVEVSLLDCQVRGWGIKMPARVRHSYCPLANSTAIEYNEHFISIAAPELKGLLFSYQIETLQLPVTLYFL